MVLTLDLLVLQEDHPQDLVLGDLVPELVEESLDLELEEGPLDARVERFGLLENRFVVISDRGLVSKCPCFKGIFPYPIK